MKLNEIFSKGELKQEDKIKIAIDYREKNSLVASELVHLGFYIEFKELKVADYIVNNTAIERKTISDFISSMINKRLSRQLEELQQYENKILIIEGFKEQELYDDSLNTGIHPNALRGFLLSILLKFKIPIIFSKDYEDTAKFISILAKKQNKEESIRANKKTFNIKEQIQFILEGFPGIGPKSAKKLLKEFKTLKNIINADIDKLKPILGKKAESFKKIVEEKY
ncbi:MAG: ERCC4 domain-containing protein [Nanoarchaeota archaeon]